MSPRTHTNNTHTLNHGDIFKSVTAQRSNVTVGDTFVLINTLPDLLKGCPKPATLISALVGFAYPWGADVFLTLKLPVN